MSSGEVLKLSESAKHFIGQSSGQLKRSLRLAGAICDRPPTNDDVGSVSSDDQRVRHDDRITEDGRTIRNRAVNDQKAARAFGASEAGGSTCAATATWKSRRRGALIEPTLNDRMSFTEREAEVMGLLDQTQHKLLDPEGNRSQVGEALDGLFGGLNSHRLTCTPEHWQSLIQTCRAHSVMPILHQDPFTGRAYAKPRGYAGDAQLIDLIYGPEDRMPDPEATALGLDIYRYTTSAPAAEGVRARRGFIADLIDDTTSEQHGRHILAIAAGHLREANLTTAVRRRRIERFVALDSDSTSLQEIDRAYGSYGVQTVHASFAVLITNRLQIGKFDVIYSTGLFDYLNQNTGRRLVTTMFDMLKPGGQLVVANFLPGIRDIGYMEAFMDWKLIYRTRQEMVDLTTDIDESEIRNLSLFAEENRNIIFLHITKK